MTRSVSPKVPKLHFPRETLFKKGKPNHKNSYYRQFAPTQNPQLFRMCKQHRGGDGQASDFQTSRGLT